jgi:hypothetical protein
MADAPETRAADPTPAEAAKAARTGGDAIDRDRLIAESNAWVGYPSHVVAGALAGITKKQLTVNEVKAAVKAFLAGEVK